MITIVIATNRKNALSAKIANIYKAILAQKGTDAHIFSLENLPADFLKLRSADPALFPDIAMFTGMYDHGALATPAAAAASVLVFLEREDFGSNPVADIRD